MRRLALVLATLIALTLILSIIGYGYAQDDGTTGTSGCCAMASAYDGSDDDSLNVIRQFRDEYLMTNPVGRGVAALYYNVLSPPVAGFIEDHPSVKPVARAAWAPVVAISTIAVDTTTKEKAAIAGTLALVSGGVFVWYKRRHRRSAL